MPRGARSHGGRDGSGGGGAAAGDSWWVASWAVFFSFLLDGRGVVLVASLSMPPAKLWGMDGPAVLGLDPSCERVLVHMNLPRGLKWMLKAAESQLLR